MPIGVANAHVLTAIIAGLDTTEVSDSGNTRTVLAITVLLVIAAVALAAVTVWYWRNTVPDPEALASLAELTESRKRSRWGLRQRMRRE